MLATQALDISTSLSNAVQYIQQIVLTSDGSNLWTTGVFIDGAGKIGIGTDSPAVQLQINGTTWGIALHNNTDWNGNEMAFLRLNWVDRNNLTWWTRIFDYLWASRIRNLEWPIKLWAGLTYPNNPSITITTWGNVGIGTDTPTSKLYVEWNSFVEWELGVYNGIDIWHNWGPISQVNFLIGGSIQVSWHYGQIFLSNNGNVGIGVSNPNYNLSFSSWSQIWYYQDSSHFNGIEFYGTNGNMIFSTKNQSHPGSFVFSWSSVGIGTDSPSADFDVRWTSLLSGNVGIKTATSPTTTLDVNWAIRITTDEHVSHWTSCSWKLWTIVFDNGSFYWCLLYGWSPEWHIMAYL